MANWVRDFLKQHPNLSNRIVKRARHAIHKHNADGAVTARFTDASIYYQDAKDGLGNKVKLRIQETFFGCL